VSVLTNLGHKLCSLRYASDILGQRRVFTEPWWETNTCDPSHPNLGRQETTGLHTIQSGSPSEQEACRPKVITINVPGGTIEIG
jgi:hypothetical protein